MQLKLICYQLETDCCNYKMYYVSVMRTTKQKPRYTKDKEKGIKVFHYKKSPSHKGRQHQRKKENTKQAENN